MAALACHSEQTVKNIQVDEHFPVCYKRDMENILTTTQAAARLGISPRRVAALITAGRLPANQFAGSWMIREQDLALVAERKPGRPKKTEGKGEPLAAEQMAANGAAPTKAKPAKTKKPAVAALVIAPAVETRPNNRATKKSTTGAARSKPVKKQATKKAGN